MSSKKLPPVARTPRENGEVVRRFRHPQGITLRDMAAQLGISVRGIGGEARNPEPEETEDANGTDE